MGVCFSRRALITGAFSGMPAFDYFVGCQDALERVLVFFEIDACFSELLLVIGLNGAAVRHEHGMAFGLGQQGRAHAALGCSKDNNVYI